MTETPRFPIYRDLDDIKAQVRKELDTVRDLMSTLSYHSGSPDWRSPHQLHRLRRALRIHYLAMKIRDTTPVPLRHRLSWELDSNFELG